MDPEYLTLNIDACVRRRLTVSTALVRGGMCVRVFVPLSMARPIQAKTKDKFSKVATET